jgi:uncharacterized protein (DUF885 family)
VRLTAGKGLRLLAAAAFFSCAVHAQETESQRFRAFLDHAYEGVVMRSPILASEYGDHVGEDRWDDVSEAGLAADAEAIRQQLAAAKSQFSYDALDASGKLQFRVFVNESQLLLDRYRWRDEFYPLNQIVGLHVEVPDVLINQQHLDSVADARTYIRRISATRTLFTQLTVRMAAQARKGIYMPKSVYPLLIDGARNVISGAPFDEHPDSAIFADFKRRVSLLSVPEQQKQRLVSDCRVALLSQLGPAYRMLIDLLQKQAVQTKVDGGVWQLPQGDQFYEFLIHQFTTTDMTPADVHALGLQEVSTVHAQIEQVMRKIGFQGSLREFMDKTRADSRFYNENTDAGREALLVRARAIVAAMQARITDEFLTAAPLPLEVRRTDAYKEASSPSAFYEPGSADGRRAGVVSLNLSDMRLQPTYELEDLLYHEGLPGHHMQISTILMDRGIPKLRKVNQWWQDTAFVEGWGLYAEQLGKDMGFYQDPYSDLGRLTGVLWRACRLVVDSGLHYKRWSREQAISYLEENSAAPHGTIVREVDRYLAVPGQATAFTVGMLKFISERERARQALGPKFDVRQYHHVVLENGYLPLWAVHDRVSEWIAAERSPFRALLEDYWQDYLQLNPALALSVGDFSSDGRFDDSLTDQWREQMLATLHRNCDALAKFNPAQLSEDDRISYSMLRYRLDSDLSFYGGRSFEVSRLLPINQFQGLHVQYAVEAAGSGAFPYKTVADYDQALLRADGFAHWADAAIGRMRQGIAQGVVLPKLIVERMLPQLQVHLNVAPESSQFWHPIEIMPAQFPAADRKRLAEAYRVEIAQVIQPAYQRLYNFLSKEYAPHARQSAGLGALPGGRDLYRYYVHYHTTTDMAPSAIHELGLAQVREISTQLAAIQGAVKFKGTLQQFFAHVRDDPQQHFARPEDVLPAFQAARDRIVPHLPSLFGVLPKAPYEVRALPDSYRQSRDNGYYSPAAADGSRPGVLWINIYAPGVQDRFNLMTISLHEGLPGHHFQTSIASERQDLPSFRRFDSTNAYVEGWGLYAESLGHEMGFYTDPWQYYGRLNYAILRANRLVIDTGIHEMGWSIAQGVRWMAEHSSMTEAQAAAEVERYAAYPGQALSYKLGELKILALRNRAQQQLGSRFDIKAFHDQILTGGSMPLQILQEKVERWLATSPSP